jgi:cytochrome P450
MIKERKAKPEEDRDDLLSILIKDPVFEADEDRLIDEAFTFVLAGS